MNKKELFNAPAEKTGLTKTEVQKALNAVIEIVANKMKQNGRIILIGFGSFSIKHKVARKRVNQTSFIPIVIPAKKVVNFKSSIYLNHLLNVKKRGRKRKDINNISLGISYNAKATSSINNQFTTLTIKIIGMKPLAYTTATLFHSYRFSQIARLIYSLSFTHCYMISQQL